MIIISYFLRRIKASIFRFIVTSITAIMIYKYGGPVLKKLYHFTLRQLKKVGDQRPKEKFARFSKVIMTEVLMPSQVDKFGVALSGVLLSWIDICAGIAAKSHAEIPCVTASVDAVQFKRPVFVGEAVIMKASVNKSWKSSMEVEVSVEAEDLKTGKRRNCCHAFLTFVALRDGRPCFVPALIPETETEIEAHEAAEKRRQVRLELKVHEGEHNAPVTDLILSEKEEAQREQPFIKDAAFQYLIPSFLECALKEVEEYEVPTSQSYTQTVQILMPQHANSLGITFGGHIIRRMEECALIAALRHVAASSVSQPLVFRNASIDSLNFKRPTKVGDVLIVRGYVSRVWRTSLEVYLTVHSYNLNHEYESDNEESTATNYNFTNDGYMTFVAIEKKDSDEKEEIKHSPYVLNDNQELFKLSALLSPVKALTAVEKWRFEQADRRRDIRLKSRERQQSI